MKILMRDDREKQWELVESNAYAAETELQTLLAESPEVISLDEIRPEAGPLVAVLREFRLPVGSIDILAFTARGDIAIVECKLDKNTQAKREVIGQILDYSAHLWGMGYEELDRQVQGLKNQSLADFVHGHVGEAGWEEETFRTNVSLALESGNFILVIAVNEINDELNKIIRYVNSAGAPSFSFAALEMRRFHHSKSEMLVPHVFGPMHAAVARPRGSRRKWDEPSFFETLGSRVEPDAQETARKILEWSYQKATRTWWGEGSQMGSFVPVYEHGECEYALFAVYTYGAVETYFYWHQYKPPFDSEQKRIELLNKLNAIDGVNLPPDAITKRPSIQLSVLAVPGRLDKLLAVYDWFIEEVRKTG